MQARAIGHTIQFLGQDFTGTTGVSFNGTPAAFTVYGDTFLTTIVPSEATTGFVTITTPSGTLKSNKKFQVRPHVYSFSPASGPVGTAVIKGSSFKQTTRVTIGGVTASSFTVNSNWQVTATVPSGGQDGKHFHYHDGSTGLQLHEFHGHPVTVFNLGFLEHTANRLADCSATQSRASRNFYIC